MGSKHDLLPSHLSKRGLKLVLQKVSLQTVAIVSGLLAGFLIGHLYQQHNQVVLVEHLYTNGQSTAKPVKTSYGYKLVVHDFSGLVDSSFHAGSGSSSSSSSSIIDPSFSSSSSGSSSSSSSTGATNSRTVDSGASTHTAVRERRISLAEINAAGGTAAAAGTSGDSGSSSSSSGAEGQQRFHEGCGKGCSIMFSRSSTTGLTEADKQRISAALKKRAAELPGDSIHALMTGNGSPYQNIQGRIMYSSMKLVQQMPGGSNIKAFTRIMHRTADDDLVGEFPTFRAYPLQPACDTWCEFPVKDRANAVVQWLMAAEQHPQLIQGAWLLLLESDYVWMKPLELPGSAHDMAVQGYGFTYDYIDPSYPAAAKVIKRMCPECSQVSQVPHSGPSPVLLRPHELALVAPDWETYSAWIEGNEHARNAFGWVREMYAWCVAVHKNGVQLTHELPPASRLMAQPPHDWTAGRAAFLHYTWATLYHQDGKEIWRFDKRDWTAKEHELKVPEFKLPPQPWQDSWKLQDGIKVNKALHNITTAMLAQMNKASALLPVIKPQD
uniref:Hydroxyproline O-arabinosyltransferase-like domain-containing protein n=1 Tax=Tetradesmus obliquus TaxID=3088 RepID=A0A383WBI5_TETOB|eukprot:jgi/Sobl393_1/16655/SZX68969.1